MTRDDEAPDADTEDGGGETLPYEQAREELVEVVRRLEAGGTTLEESLALWERGEQLASICQRWLDGARQRLEQVRAAGAAGGGREGDEDAAPAG